MCADIQCKSMRKKTRRRWPLRIDLIRRRVDDRDDVLVLDVEVNPVCRRIVHHILRNAWNTDGGDDRGFDRIDHPDVGTIVMRDIYQVIQWFIENRIGRSGGLYRRQLSQSFGIDDGDAFARLDTDVITLRIGVDGGIDGATKL